MSLRPSLQGVRRAVGAATIVLLVSGCGSASEPSPPAGVDELVVPTPSPDPADFVDAIDNPWLPLAVGSAWTYEVSGGEPAQVSMVTVEEGPVVLGVQTTAVRTVSQVPPGDRLSEEVDLYAQDRAGNVWLFGLGGQFTAGEDGAQAGIAMLARPRIGDGYRPALSDLVDLRVEVLALDGAAETTAGSYDDLVVTDTTMRAGDGTDEVVRNYYARGVGLVYRETVGDTPGAELELAAYEP